MKDVEEGAVTAEFAVALPAVIVLLAFLLGASATGVSVLQLEEASRQGARALARGENQEKVLEIVHTVDTDIAAEIRSEDGKAVVTTSRKAPGIIGAWGNLTLSSEAVVPLENTGADNE